MASAMHIEVDGEEVDPALCTRANGWKTAGEKLKKGPPGNGGKAAKAPPDAGCSPKMDGAERTKRPPIKKGRLLKNRDDKNEDEVATVEVLQADPNEATVRDQGRRQGAPTVAGAAAPGRNHGTTSGEVRGGGASSRGRPGEQQGSATKKVGWANGSPKSLDSEFPALNPSSPSSKATTKENAEIAELKEIIGKQNAQILEQNAQIKGIMSKIDQLVAKADQGTVNEQAETNAAVEAPRKMPRRRSPSPTSSKTQAPQKQEAMEAEEAHTSETATQLPVEEQKQLTYGETIILAALKRMEDRLNMLETKHEKYAARVAAIEIRMKPTSLKKE
ncbi:hypothetical protein HPB49_007510 [Dermacentor silvarum]|uniref:Uncharacterized protein n=1 Tax=Dermacentor silvarum TaxID=543639 RepID=A0ACB8DBZ4_DERSI|nr:hypothetical protein HPB49_007510 [Dermacentor silvarum]